MRDERCGACGNAIPDWANGVCQRCLMLEQERKRFGTNRVQPSDHESRFKEFPPALPTRGSDASSTFKSAAPPPELGLRTRLEGVNRLLADVYFTRVRLSDVLQQHGFAPEQIAVLRTDHVRLLATIKALVAMWLAQWNAAGCSHETLDRWYGLTQRQQSIPDLARTVGGSPFHIHAEHDHWLTYIHTAAGRTQFEQTLIDVTKQHLPS